MSEEKIKISGNQLQIGNTVYQLDYKVLDYIINLQEVLDKIKEEVLEELQNCKPKDLAISMEISYIEDKLERLLEEIE